MYDELVKRLREVSCGAKDTLWWQAADAIEELQAELNHIHEIMSMWKLPEPPKEANDAQR